MACHTQSVSSRLRVVLLLTLGVAAFIGACIYYYRGQDTTTQALMARFPAGSAVLGVDFAALRRAGVIDAFTGGVTEEADYKTFVERTGFDYKRDLDHALLAFAPRAKYFLLRGRFHWKALESYASAEGGGCRNRVCRMTGSTPERRISFFPLHDDVMAMAVAPDENAVEVLRNPGSAPALAPPGDPVWLTLPQAAIRSGDVLPAGTRMFARSMEQAESVVLSLGPESSRFAARLDVRCRNPQEASEIAAQLNRTTALLRDFIAREKQKPNAGDLSGVLTSGSFRSEGVRVRGYWPIERAFLDNLLAGGTS
jgi:hypothetical protein